MPHRFTFVRAATPVRPPRAPLLSCLHPAVFVKPAPWSLALRAPDAGTKSSPAAAQGYRCARWRVFLIPVTPQPFWKQPDSDPSFRITFFYNIVNP